MTVGTKAGLQWVKLVYDEELIHNLIVGIRVSMKTW
jgi:hypothetical protein